MAVLTPHTPAPAFDLPDQNGKRVKLSDFQGKFVVIYFYPKALTSGCTTQACDLRDGLDELTSRNVEVLGISPDKPALLKKFEAKEGLNFTLLGDETHSVAENYGVWQEKSMYGKKYMGMARTTFIVSPQGEILQVWQKVDPKTHFQTVLDWVNAHVPAKS